MKRKKKKKILRKFLVILFILMLGNISRNAYYNYKFNHHYEENKSDIISANTNDLKTLAKTNPKIKIIMKNKESYPKVLLEMLSRNLDMTDYVLGYLDKKGQVNTDNIGKVTKGKFPLLMQYDTRWGYGIYGDDVIAINGCGPTSLAMVIAGLTGRNDITPYDIALYSYQNGHYANGTSWSLFTTGVKHYGIIGEELSLSKDKMVEELEQNHPIICSMSKGYFTTTGHIIVITGIKDEKFIINDPNSKERSNTLWSYERIKTQIRNLWSFKLNE